MTWLEMAPVGDAWSVPQTRVRRLYKLYQFTLDLVFPSTTVPINNKLSCFCWWRNEEEVIEWGWVRVARLSKGVSALMSPLSFLNLLVPVFGC